jgi:SAM-dependent methyltransferase
MERLAHVFERLDGPLDDQTSLVGNLRDLRRINRFLGGASLSLRALDGLTADDSGPLRILDVGTGSADIPLAMLGASTAGRIVQITAVDGRPEVLGAARVLDSRLDAEPRLKLEVADGRWLPYADRSFDVVHASLLVHHLEPVDAALLLAELRRVALRGVIVNDLVRSTTSWMGAWLIAHLLTRNPLTRHDAPLSVRRAYTFAELRALARTAGLEMVGMFRGPFGHRWSLSLRPRLDEPR